jgi:predicted AAA+ superfamily ATPase
MNRTLAGALERRVHGKLARATILTGARQTGKTTLLRRVFGAWPYISFDDPVARPAYTAMSAPEWRARFPRAVLDEVQKAPAIIETIKAVLDSDPKARYVLSGSSQILLLSRAKETLAGRVSIDELWPSTLPELATASWDDPVRPSRLLRWLDSPEDARLLDGVPTSEPAFGHARRLFDHYLRWGGMPALSATEVPDGERRDWLRDYRRTYLERDVADLASLRDLEPFVRAQTAIGHRTGTLLNVADFARAAGVSHPTAQRFLRYLELSYQVVVLAPYYRNADKRLAKQAKVHFIDPGVWRSVVGHWGPLAGAAYESAIVAEIIKQTRNAGVEARFFHLRTHDGREVDLLIELEGGFVAIEVKQTRRVARTDGRHLLGLAELLDRPVLGAFVVSEDPAVRMLAPGVRALPAAWVLH